MTAAGTVPDLLPARILNEHVYCPRLAYLEWSDRQWAESADTAEGTFGHRRTDRPRGSPPDPAGPADGDDAGSDPPPSTAVAVSSERLGLTAVVDLLEPRGNTVVPIEYKRGSPLSPDQPLRDPELAQLCAQVLVLRDAGYVVEHGEAFFFGTRTRHRVDIDEHTIETTLAAIGEVRRNAERTTAPPPLVNSPKCARCSLVGICLPDEINLLRDATPGPPRRLVAGDRPGTAVYVTGPQARLTKRRGRLILLEDGEEVASRRLLDVSQVSVFGNATVSAAAMRTCLETSIPVLWFTHGGWFQGFAISTYGGNVQLRIQQHRAAAVGAGSIASAFVAGKIRNQRTLVRRHGGSDAAPAVAQLAELAAAAEQETSSPSLLGLEGTAARIYFSRFAQLLRGAPGTFELTGRNRRPPTDPVNAMLSLAYAMLAKDCTVALLAAGFDPLVGLFHRPRFGRPALALDLAEEFRALIADSAVLTAVNNGEISAGDFIARAGAVSLTPAGRKRFITTYERRMAAEITHPIFGYRTSYRRALELQARLLAAVLAGDTPKYRPLTTR